MSVPGSVVIEEITSGAVCVFALQELKRRFPQLEGLQPWVMRTASAIWALISVILISYEWMPYAGGGGQLILTLPSLGGAIMAVWHWAEQFAVNEVVYRTAAKTGGAPGGAPAKAPVPSAQPNLPPGRYSMEPQK